MAPEVVSGWDWLSTPMPSAECVKPGHLAAAEAIKLLEDALFLRVNGERPPGAPPDDPQAETWAGWERRAEEFLRRITDG